MVPNAESHVQGIINLRGSIVTVLDLASKLGYASNFDEILEKRVIIIENKNIVVGFEVDEVNEVLKIPAEKIEPPPQISQQEGFLAGVGKVNEKLLLLLNIDTLIS